MLMSLLIRYAHIPFYFCFSFAFSTSPIHHYAPLLQCNCAHTRTTIALAPSDQSRALAPRSQALSITSPYAHFLVCHSYLTCLYLPFAQNIITEALTNCLYESPPELRFSTYALHRLTLISHYFASHHTAMIPLSLLATIHLETIPYPQIAPPQSPIGFILRSPAP